MNEGNKNKLVSLSKWLNEMGVTNTTGWRWRKKGMLQVINIYGRLYLTEEAIAEFVKKAGAGEFSKNIKPKSIAA
jgi:hypothetical protein